jgi:hypothetical protein
MTNSRLLYTFLLAINLFVIKGQDYNNLEECLIWIGKNIQKHTEVLIRFSYSSQKYEYRKENIRFFNITQIQGCNITLERHDLHKGEYAAKTVYQISLNELDPYELKIAIEKYSRNPCLVLLPKTRGNKFIVQKFVTNKDKKPYITKNPRIIIEFNQKSKNENIPQKMKKAFLFAINNCNDDPILR